MIAIAIISLIGSIISTIEALLKKTLDINIWLSIIATIAWWKISLTVSILLLTITIIAVINSVMKK